ncbi:MAG: glycosyltransferase family 2 protein [bacterium]|nr:glycosyltransferase family 2 protein [bacterium]
MTPLPPGKNLALVSIGLPTYNRATLLPKAIDALLNQTYKNIELIVSDNASSDDTEKIMETYANRDHRIRYIRQKQNIGGNPNHEFVVKQAKGEYFMWVSDDDWWDKRFVEELTNALESNPDFGVAMSHYIMRYVKDGVPIRDEERTHDLTSASYQDNFKMHFRGKKGPIFFFGLYRTSFLKKILKRPFKATMHGPLLFLSEVALSAKMYSVPKVLHTRFQDIRSRLERHPDHPHTLIEHGNFPVTQYIFTVFIWIWTSSEIAFKRKFLMLKPWSRRVLIKKRKIAMEFWRFFSKKFLPFNKNT